MIIPVGARDRASRARKELSDDVSDTTDVRSVQQEDGEYTARGKHSITHLVEKGIADVKRDINTWKKGRDMDVDAEDTTSVSQHSSADNSPHPTCTRASSSTLGSSSPRPKSSVSRYGPAMCGSLGEGVNVTPTCSASSSPTMKDPYSLDLVAHNESHAMSPQETHERYLNPTTCALCGQSSAQTKNLEQERMTSKICLLEAEITEMRARLENVTKQRDDALDLAADRVLTDLNQTPRQVRPDSSRCPRPKQHAPREIIRPLLEQSPQCTPPQKPRMLTRTSHPSVQRFNPDPRVRAGSQETVRGVAKPYDRNLREVARTRERDERAKLVERSSSRTGTLTPRSYTSVPSAQPRLRMDDLRTAVSTGIPSRRATLDDGFIRTLRENTNDHSLEHFAVHRTRNPPFKLF